MKAKIWLAWKKLNGPADRGAPVKLPIIVAGAARACFQPRKCSRRNNRLGSAVHQRTRPAHSGKSFRRARRDERRTAQTCFRRAQRSDVRSRARSISKARPSAHEPKFLSENLVISPRPGKAPKYLFLFPRSMRALVEQIVQDLRERLSRTGVGSAATRVPIGRRELAISVARLTYAAARRQLSDCNLARR